MTEKLTMTHLRFLIPIIIICCFGCQSNSEKLPILSYKIDDEGKKVNYSITYDNFTNQLNESFSTDNLKDKVFIANFFFTSCPSICPPMRTELIKIAETFEKEDHFMIVSHTIDAKNDTVDVLKNYAEATGIPIKKWQLLRADEAQTKLQANQYMTNFKPNEDGTDFYHSSYVALVDKDKMIRGFYNVLVKEDVERLMNDINILLH